MQSAPPSATHLAPSAVSRSNLSSSASASRARLNAALNHVAPDRVPIDFGSTAVTGETAALEGMVPAARVHALSRRIPGLTGGEGVLESAFDHFAPVSGGEVPERARWDANPLDRKEYLMRVQRGV